MARPRFEVVDDPLALSAADDRRPEQADASPPPEPAVAPTRKPARARKQERAKASGSGPAKRSDGDAQASAQPAGLWEPPALDEPLTLVATRLPQSLDRALDEHTQRLRRRRDGASQKGLPKQEVVAMAIWALGDPHDERAHARLEALYEQYRGRRLAAAAAAAMENSRAALPEE